MLASPFVRLGTNALQNLFRPLFFLTVRAETNGRTALQLAWLVLVLGPVVLEEIVTGRGMRPTPSMSCSACDGSSGRNTGTSPRSRGAWRWRRGRISFSWCRWRSATCSTRRQANGAAGGVAHLCDDRVP